ncbi:MAG: hypothetical protein JXQ27_13230 [Acidobacteria bacterium]|nr:hypothetical protein [Acidobacteriota bacterium]
MARRFVTILIIFLLAVGGVILLGYGSALLSSGAAERHTARWIAFDILDGGHFFVLQPKPDDPSPNSVDSLRIFRSVGAKANEYRRTGAEFDGFPWGDVHRAEIRGPFVAAVRYGYVGAPLSGEGGTRTYLCLFGWVLLLDQRAGWVT